MKTLLTLALAGSLVGCSGQPGTCSSPRVPHLASCTDACCGDGNNPPLGGGHCADWLPCRVYAAEQNRCQWIHNLEHGHLVLLYNCPGGCPDIVTQLENVWQAQPVAGNGARRALLAPDSRIPQAVAAVVWGHAWIGDAFDQTGIDAVLAHQDEAAVPEAGLLCAP